MKLEVRLFDGLKCGNSSLACWGQHEFVVEVPDNITIEDLHNHLSLSSPYTLINMVNGIAQDKSWSLKDRDRVGIFPPSGGG